MNSSEALCLLILSSSLLPVGFGLLYLTIAAIHDIIFCNRCDKAIAFVIGICCAMPLWTAIFTAFTVSLITYLKH